MIKRIDWLQREFAFNLPVGMFPYVVERLRGAPPRAADRVRSLPREVLTRREGDDWSIQENIGHLLDLEALWLGRLDDFEAGLSVLRAADMTNRKTHEADHNSRSIDELLEAFRAEREKLVRRLETYDEAFVARAVIHPRLEKEMRVLDLALFTAEHDDYHLAIVSELMRKFSSATDQGAPSRPSWISS